MEQIRIKKKKKSHLTLRTHYYLSTHQTNHYKPFKHYQIPTASLHALTLNDGPALLSPVTNLEPNNAADTTSPRLILVGSAPAIN